jgi:hypothetical protein
VPTALTGTAAAKEDEGYTCQNGILSLLSGFSTFVVLHEHCKREISLKWDKRKGLPAVSIIEFTQDQSLQFESGRSSANTVCVQFRTLPPTILHQDLQTLASVLPSALSPTGPVQVSSARYPISSMTRLWYIYLGQS